MTALGLQPYPIAYYAIGSLAALRLLYLFFMATPVQAAALSSVPSMIGWILTLLNVITQSQLGDWLAMLIDSFFFGLQKWFAFRMQMVEFRWNLECSTSAAP